MEKLHQKTLEEYIVLLAALPQGTSYGELCSLYAMSEKQKMQIDRTLQKLRKADKIYLVRKNGKVLWHATQETTSQTAANG